jgi:hypothetical protein
MSTTTATLHDGPLGRAHTVRAYTAAERSAGAAGVLDGHGPLEVVSPM